MSIEELPASVTAAGIASRMEHVSEAATLRIAARANELRTEGRSIVSLSTGEPDFPTPERIKQAGIRAIQENRTKYTAAEGIPQLREVVAQKFERDNGIRTSADRIQISSGGKHALSNAVLSLIERGDEVLIPSPYWVSYPAMVGIAEGTPRYLETSEADHWQLDPAAVRKAITPRTKAIMLNSPHNPTSAVYPIAELQQLAAIIEETGMYAIVDELYEKLIYDGTQHISLGSIPEIADRVITVNGLSKAYAMTGWRLGYATGPAHVIEAMNRLQSQAVSHPSSISQYAAIEALTGDQSDVVAMRERFETRRNLVTRLLGAIEGISFAMPRAAFYVFFNVSAFLNKRHVHGSVETATDLCTVLLEHHGLALVPGEAFGAPGYVRLSFAASEADIDRGVALLAEGLAAIS